MTLRRAFSAATLGALLWSCEPLVWEPINTDTNPADNGTADLSISNQLSTFPGPYVFYLYNSAAQNAQGNEGKVIGEVGENKFSTFKVPPGSWKLAMGQSGGTIIEMTKTAGSVDWPTVDIQKDSAYGLIVWNDNAESGIINWQFGPLSH